METLCIPLKITDCKHYLFSPKVYCKAFNTGLAFSILHFGVLHCLEGQQTASFASLCCLLLPTLHRKLQARTLFM